MKYNLDINIISKFTSNNDVFHQAYLLYKNKQIEILNSFESNNQNIVQSIIRNDVTEPHVHLVFDSAGNLVEYKCSCEALKIWRGACVHATATLFLLNSIKYPTHETSTPIINSSTVLKKFKDLSIKNSTHILSSVTSQDIKVELTPELYINYDGQPFLTFTIGTTKMYVLKSISEFCNNFKSNKIVSYGKSLSFLHNIDSFNKQSQKLISFLLSQVEHITDSLNVYNNYTTNPFDFSRFFRLTSHALDIFFNLYKETTIKCKFDYLSLESVFLTNSKPKIEFSIAMKNSSIYLSRKYYSYQYFVGSKYSYYFDQTNQRIHRVSHEYQRVTDFLFNETTSKNDFTINFANEEISEFLTLVLPKLKKHELVSNTKEIDEKFKIDVLNKKIYLDTEGNSIRLKAFFCYGELEINSLSSKKHDIFRDNLEEGILNQIISAYSFEAVPAQDYYILKDNDKIYHFYKYGISHFTKVAIVYATDEFSNKAPKTSYPKTSFGIKMRGNLLEISPEGESFSMMELINAVSSYNLKKKYFRLNDGSFVNLEDIDISDTAEFINSLDLSKKDISNNVALLPAYRALYVDRLIDEQIEEDKNRYKRDTAFAKLTNDFNNYKDSNVEIPKSLEGILREYQKAGFKWLYALSRYNFGGILADDMGLGKTLQIITLILHAKEENDKVLPSLVVAPTSLIYNWEKEFEKFAPIIKTLVVAGNFSKRTELLNKKADVYITTYDLLKRDIALYKDMQFNFAISDEAQNIKNSGTQNAKAIKQINCLVKFALTGTPVENSLSELWSILDFAMPGYLYTNAKFTKLYETPIVKNNDKGVSEKLKKQISPFILRRLKSDVLSEIPDKVETTLYAELEEEQRKIYTAYLMKAKGELLDCFDKNMFAESQLKILSYITRLRQICCHPSLFIDSYAFGSGKLDIAMETIKNSIESGHRILLFSQFTTMLSIVRSQLEKEKIDYFYLDGSTKAKQRLEMSEAFNEGKNNIFLISLKAGGVGLNLIGADIVIHFDPWWNPAVMDQASDRAHRIGQKNVVQIFNIVAKGTIEEKILELQAKKKHLIDSIISGGANFINGMTEQELFELFSDNIS